MSDGSTVLHLRVYENTIKTNTCDSTVQRPTYALAMLFLVATNTADKKRGEVTAKKVTSRKAKENLQRFDNVDEPPIQEA